MKLILDFSLVSHSPKISIITATYNADATLPSLIESLCGQIDQDFEWVVADGGSTDDTLALLEAAKRQLKSVVVDSRPDFGIYHALNCAIKMASGEFYLVAGADDFFSPQAVAEYRRAISETGADLITARIESAGRIHGPRRKWPWLYGPFAYVSGHAVGLAVRRSLHARYGYYSNKLPIAADQLFILKTIQGGSTLSVQSFVAGHFSHATGLSGQNVLGSLLEGFRAQVATGQSLTLQAILLALRLLKNWKRIKEKEER